MPQAAWEALFRDAVQGLRLPYTPETVRWWLQTTGPRPWAIGAPLSSPHHQHTWKGKCKWKARRKQARRGPR